MCKYEMDPASTCIVEDTEQTGFCPQTDGQTDRRTDGRSETSTPPFNFVEARGIINKSKYRDSNFRVMFSPNKA